HRTPPAGTGGNNSRPPRGSSGRRRFVGRAEGGAVAEPDGPGVPDPAEGDDGEPPGGDALGAESAREGVPPHAVSSPSPAAAVAASR
ncbi:hypothetical protein ACWHA1_38515, partial [Streptomyces decoyicus]